MYVYKFNDKQSLLFLAFVIMCVCVCVCSYIVWLCTLLQPCDFGGHFFTVLKYTYGRRLFIDVQFDKQHSDINHNDKTQIMDKMRRLSRTQWMEWLIMCSEIVMLRWEEQHSFNCIYDVMEMNSDHGLAIIPWYCYWYATGMTGDWADLLALIFVMFFFDEIEFERWKYIYWP